MDCGPPIDLDSFILLLRAIQYLCTMLNLCRKQDLAGRLRRMLREVQVLGSEFFSLKLTFCYWEANNRAADLLAKNAAATQSFFWLHRAGPDFLLSSLYKDRSGMVAGAV